MPAGFHFLSPAYLTGKPTTGLHVGPSNSRQKTGATTHPAPAEQDQLPRHAIDEGRVEGLVRPELHLATARQLQRLQRQGQWEFCLCCCTATCSLGLRDGDIHRAAYFGTILALPTLCLQRVDMVRSFLASGTGRRRHHCRTCGGLFCRKCCPPATWGGERKCKSCKKDGSGARVSVVDARCPR